MWLNQSVVTINVMFKILDIMSLRYIYIYILINKFRFSIGALNPNMSFPYMQVHKNGPKGIEVGTNGLYWTKWEQGGWNWIE